MTQRVVTISARLERADSRRARMGKRAGNNPTNSSLKARVIELAFVSAVALNGAFSVGLKLGVLGIEA